MPFDILRDESFLPLLFMADQEHAQAVRGAGCPLCGGRLDSGSYFRKSRGWLCEVPADYFLRFSWCCRVVGCRKRVTPESLRFLGRKVYLSAAIVLTSVFLHGMTRRRVAQLRDLLGVSPRTVADWRRWWLAAFRPSAFWKSYRGLFAGDLDEDALPHSIWASFRGSTRERLLFFLRFLHPLTSPPDFVF